MWLALRLTHWALDCCGPSSDNTPCLVVASDAQRQRVQAANQAAIDAGIRRGMGLGDARMRLAQATVYARNTAAERAAMDRLAGWAWGYSNHIHWAIADDQVESSRIILEIGASVRLFGGRRALLGRIRDDMQAFGYRYCAGVGYTPQAALAFARARRTPGHKTALVDLPISCLGLADEVHATLTASGIHRAGELLALPPAALMRRFGPDAFDALERLRGRRPHGLSLYRLPARYRTRHELAGAVEHTRELIFVLRRVFEELAAFLRGTDSAIQTLRLQLSHEREPATRLTLRLAAPTHDARHLERVAHERLTRLSLSAPVLEIGLVSDRLRPADHTQNDFWCTDAETRAANWPAVLDRLRARLGHEAVSWVDRPADHRPEAASTRPDTPPASNPASANNADCLPRPLWLLDPPEPVAENALATMRWISGPERIESGWWGIGCRRDYYRAVDETGRLVWLYLDLESARHGQARYYLHGLFG